jgi:hypothetical protein
MCFKLSRPACLPAKRQELQNTFFWCACMCGMCVHRRGACTDCGAGATGPWLQRLSDQLLELASGLR